MEYWKPVKPDAWRLTVLLATLEDDQAQRSATKVLFVGAAKEVPRCQMSNAPLITPLPL
jgi:hypothetical protein